MGNIWKSKNKLLTQPMSDQCEISLLDRLLGEECNQSAYAPICTVLATPVPPCRHLCNSAKHGCEALTKRVDFTWPESFNCDRFPELGEEICVGDNKSDSEARDCSKKTEDFNEPLGELQEKFKEAAKKFKIMHLALDCQ
ncbi:hypothetical protein ACROYT_G019181 [Oculina patagonica]